MRRTKFEKEKYLKAVLETLRSSTPNLFASYSVYMAYFSTYESFAQEVFEKCREAFKYEWLERNLSILLLCFLVLPPPLSLSLSLSSPALSLAFSLSLSLLVFPSLSLFLSLPLSLSLSLSLSLFLFSLFVSLTLYTCLLSTGPFPTTSCPHLTVTCFQPTRP